jgi:type II secretion system protein H
MRGRMGFTLIELLITIVIAGILAAVALPNLGPLKAKQELNQGVALMEDSFRQAQERALSKGNVVHLQFDLAANSYWLCDGNCANNQKIALPPLPTDVYIMDTDFVDSTQKDRNGDPEFDDEVAFDYEGRVVDRGDILGHIVVGHRTFPFRPYEVYLASLTGTTWTIQPEVEDEKK